MSPREIREKVEIGDVVKVKMKGALYGRAHEARVLDIHGKGVQAQFKNGLSKFFRWNELVDGDEDGNALRVVPEPEIVIKPQPRRRTTIPPPPATPVPPNASLAELAAMSAAQGTERRTEAVAADITDPMSAAAAGVRLSSWLQRYLKREDAERAAELCRAVKISEPIFSTFKTGVYAPHEAEALALAAYFEQKLPHVRADWLGAVQTMAAADVAAGAKQRTGATHVFPDKRQYRAGLPPMPKNAPDRPRFSVWLAEWSARNGQGAQGKLSQRSGIAPGDITHFKQKQTTPNSADVIKLAKAFESLGEQPPGGGDWASALAHMANLDAEAGVSVHGPPRGKRSSNGHGWQAPAATPAATTTATGRAAPQSQPPRQPRFSVWLTEWMNDRQGRFAELARRTGISKATIGRIKDAEVAPGESDIERLGAALATTGRSAPEGAPDWPTAIRQMVERDIAAGVSGRTYGPRTEAPAPAQHEPSGRRVRFSKWLSDYLAQAKPGTQADLGRRTALSEQFVYKTKRAMQTLNQDEVIAFAKAFEALEIPVPSGGSDWATEIDAMVKLDVRAGLKRHQPRLQWAPEQQPEQTPSEPPPTEPAPSEPPPPARAVPVPPPHVRERVEQAATATIMINGMPVTADLATLRKLLGAS